jgi:hypothetical protein
MTPKLKLRDADRKVSLSAIENFCMPGNWRTTMSTHMMLAPTTQATPLMHVMIHPRVSLSSPIFEAASCGLPNTAREEHEMRSGSCTRVILKLADAKTDPRKRKRKRVGGREELER